MHMLERNSSGSSLGARRTDTRKDAFGRQNVSVNTPNSQHKVRRIHWPHQTCAWFPSRCAPDWRSQWRGQCCRNLHGNSGESQTTGCPESRKTKGSMQRNAPLTVRRRLNNRPPWGQKNTGVNVVERSMTVRRRSNNRPPWENINTGVNAVERSTDSQETLKQHTVLEDEKQRTNTCESTKLSHPTDISKTLMHVKHRLYYTFTLGTA